MEGFEDALGTTVLGEIVVDEGNPHRFSRTNVLGYRFSPRIEEGLPQYSRGFVMPVRCARTWFEEEIVEEYRTPWVVQTAGSNS
jgi:hypothetical protein